MYRPGHYGAALIAYTPLGALVLALGFEQVAVLGGAIAVGGAMLPDYDQQIPGISHRGITHTVWFALAVGIGLALVGGAIGRRHGPGATVALAGFGLAVGVITVGAHVLADALTPMGVRPFAPLDDTKYTFEVATASNPIANYGLLAFGITVSGLGLWLAATVQ